MGFEFWGLGFEVCNLVGLGNFRGDCDSTEFYISKHTTLFQYWNIGILRYCNN